jgi:hypothetical protein
MKTNDVPASHCSRCFFEFAQPQPRLSAFGIRINPVTIVDEFGSTVLCSNCAPSMFEDLIRQIGGMEVTLMLARPKTAPVAPTKKLTKCQRGHLTAMAEMTVTDGGNYAWKMPSNTFHSLYVGGLLIWDARVKAWRVTRAGHAAIQTGRFTPTGPLPAIGEEIRRWARCIECGERYHPDAIRGQGWVCRDCGNPCQEVTDRANAAGGAR